MTVSAKQILILLVSLSAALPQASACTVFFLSKASDPVVAKNLDWSSSRGMVAINKRNVQKAGTLIGSQVPAKWVSKYMTLTLTQNGREFPWEGMNEAGLSVNSLQLSSSVVPSPSDPTPSLEMLQWIQFILDTSANVPEAIQNAQRVKIALQTTIHYFVCDANARCAVFEYLNGLLFVHQTGMNLQYPALSNDTYPDSYSYFQNLVSSQSANAILTNQSANSLDRFSRAALWSIGWPGNDVTGYGFRGLQNVAEANTVWSMVFNLREKAIAIRTSASPQMKWVSLSEFNPSCRSAVQIADVNTEVAGDFSAAFVDYTSSANEALLSLNVNLNPQIRQVMSLYPESGTSCLEP